MQRSVLHVAPALWSGAGSVITRLAEDQARRGPVIVVTSSRRGLDRDWPEYRRRLRSAGVVHAAIDLLSRDRHVFRASVGRLRDLIERHRPDVVHAHAGVPSLAAVLARAASRTQPRVIGQMYSWNPTRPPRMNVEDGLGFGATDRVVCSARAYEALLLDYGVARRQLVYLPWGLPLDSLPCREHVAPAASARPRRIGFVGRIEPRKNQLTLVAVAATLQRRFPGLQLELVGPVADADYAARIHAAIREQSLSGITVTEQVPNPHAFSRTWDLFVSLSTDEGQGLAALEAMALGVPVAARLVAGISDFLIDGRTGVALPSASIRAISRTIADALENERHLLRLARQARRLVERRYDWRQTVAAFDRLYGA